MLYYLESGSTGALPGGRRSNASARLDLRQSRVLQHPIHHHLHYQWSPLNQQREYLRWPNNARVAVCVIVALEHMEWNPPPGTYQNPVLSGGYGASSFPDVTRWSHREYGHRVGIFRLLDLLRKHGLKPTVAMDVLTAQNYPFLVRYCQSQGCEINVPSSGVCFNRPSEEDPNARSLLHLTNVLVGQECVGGQRQAQ